MLKLQYNLKTINLTLKHLTAATLLDIDLKSWQNILLFALADVWSDLNNEHWLSTAASSRCFWFVALQETCYFYFIFCLHLKYCRTHEYMFCSSSHFCTATCILYSIFLKHLFFSMPDSKSEETFPVLAQLRFFCSFLSLKCMNNNSNICCFLLSSKPEVCMHMISIWLNCLHTYLGSNFQKLLTMSCWNFVTFFLTELEKCHVVGVLMPSLNLRLHKKF